MNEKRHQKREHGQTIAAKQDFPVSIRVTSESAKYSQTAATYHPELEFQLICQGRCQYFVRDKNYRLTACAVAIIHKNEVHSFTTDTDSRLKKACLVFSPDVLKDRANVAAIIARLETFFSLVLPEKTATAAELIMKEIAEESQTQGAFWREVVLDNIERFLVILYRATDSAAHKLADENPLMQEIIEYLEQNFAERLSLTEVAERFNMSQFSLSRMFKEYTGLGFRHYLIHRRIVEAKKLLEETDLKITTVALKAGFDDISTFYRDFRLLTGVSPSTYRKISD